MGRGAWLILVGVALWSAPVHADPAPPLRAEPLATGILEVVSPSPGEPVHVDGSLRGTTPLRVAGLFPGIHVVEVGPAGAIVRKDVLIKAGAVALVDAGSAGSPSDAASVPASTPTQRARNWVRGQRVLAAVLHQPWAYLSAAACGIALVGAGILWTSTPQRFPVVGKLPMDVTPLQYQVARWGAVGVVAVLALGTAVLFVLPTLPILRDLAPSAPSS